MANPYPIAIADSDSGVVKMAGAATFTDPANQPGGGSQPWQLVTVPIAFDTPGLNNGVSVFVPTIGQLLYDAWFEVTTAFNGTTPQADLSQFTGAAAPQGLVAGVGSPHDMSVASSINNGGGPANVVTAESSSLLTMRFNNGAPLPAVFTSVDPLLVVVSRDGNKGGAAIGGSAGTANVRLLVLTPS